LGVGRFKLFDRVHVLQRQVQVVHALHQTFAPERVNRECMMCAIGEMDFAGLQIDGDVAHRACQQGLADALDDHSVQAHR